MLTRNHFHFCSMVLLLLSMDMLAQQRGFQNINLDINGQSVSLYKQSHALVIGISQYTNGWPDLPGVKSDVAAIKQVLENKGFNVVPVENTTDQQLDEAIADFISRYGAETENRLLIYFAGHGHTIKTNYGDELGYIVPSNAPNPNINVAAFQRYAMEMARIEIYAKRIQSKHVLFVFDACFSGQLFALSRAVPQVIGYKTAQPVRQFITSGSADETVPDNSVFRRQFVNGLNGEADLNHDNYITGSELGDFLQTSVINYSYNAQHPQFGKIRNPNLDKGDFVFVLQSAQPAPPERTVSINEENIASYGSIQLTTEISGALYLDGTYLKQVSSNTRVTLNDIGTGTHTLNITGEEDWVKTITVTKNNIATITTSAPISSSSSYSSSTSPSASTSFIEMVFVKGGSFTMGSPANEAGRNDDETLHLVTLSDFYIGKYEVTQKQWQEIMGSNPSGFSGCDNCPVENVSWNDIQEFIKELNQKTGKNYRLPTEAEWEYASNGGNQSKITTYSNNNIDEVAWYSNNSGSKTHSVGQKKANELGIYDMNGNIWEWCNDWYGSYPSGKQTNPQGPSPSVVVRVNRGGSWNSNAGSCRSSNRSNLFPDDRYSNVGFRLAASSL